MATRIRSCERAVSGSPKRSIVKTHEKQRVDVVKQPCEERVIVQEVTKSPVVQKRVVPSVCDRVGERIVVQEVAKVPSVQTRVEERAVVQEVGKAPAVQTRVISSACDRAQERVIVQEAARAPAVQPRVISSVCEGVVEEEIQKKKVVVQKVIRNRPVYKTELRERVEEKEVTVPVTEVIEEVVEVPVVKEVEVPVVHTIRKEVHVPQERIVDVPVYKKVDVVVPVVIQNEVTVPDVRVNRTYVEQLLPDEEISGTRSVRHVQLECERRETEPEIRQEIIIGEDLPPVLGERVETLYKSNNACVRQC